MVTFLTSFRIFLAVFGVGDLREEVAWTQDLGSKLGSNVSRTGVGHVWGTLFGVFSVWAFFCHMRALHELHNIPNFPKIISKMT